MIPQDLVDHILHIISWHRTWLAVKDFGSISLATHLRPDIEIRIIKCRVLRLEVRIERDGFYKHQLLSIPEFAIEDAIRLLSFDTGFKLRVKSRSLSFKDVNEIVRIGSFDSIPLELDI